MGVSVSSLGGLGDGGVVLGDGSSGGGGSLSVCLSGGRGMGMSSFGCVDFRVSRGHPREASWLYSLEPIGMGRSELWMAVGTVEPVAWREGMREKHLGDRQSC